MSMSIKYLDSAKSRRSNLRGWRGVTRRDRQKRKGEIQGVIEKRQDCQMSGYAEGENSNY